MAQAAHPEEILGKAYDFRLIRRLWQFIVPYKRLFFLSLLLLPLQQGFGLAQPYLMKIGIDQYIANKDLWGLQNVMLLFLGALIGETLAAFAHYYLAMLVAQRCLADLRVAIFAHVQQLQMSYFDRNPVGRLVTRMTTDVDVLQEMFSSGVVTLAADFIMARRAEFSHLKFDNVHGPEQIVSDSVDEVVARLNRQLDADDEVKIVIADRGDYEWARGVVGGELQPCGLCKP